MSIHLSFRIEPEQDEQNKVLLEQLHQKDKQIEELQKLLLEKERQSFWKKLFPRN